MFCFPLLLTLAAAFFVQGNPVEKESMRGLSGAADLSGVSGVAGRKESNEVLKWKKVFYHDTTGGLFTGAADTLRKNPDDEDAELFSILYDLEEMRGVDGYFHLKLCYPERTDVEVPCNEWFQTSNPAKDSTITGYIPVKIAFPNDGYSPTSPFGGLGVNPDNTVMGTYINSQPDTKYGWYEIGASQYHNSSAPTIQGPYPEPYVTKVVLYADLNDPEPGCAIIYSRINYEGNVKVIQPRTVDQFSTWNNRIQSMRVTDGCLVAIYVERMTGNGGKWMSFTSDVPIYQERFNRNITSFGCHCGDESTN